MEYHVSTPLTVAMPDTQGRGLWQLFGQLKHQEYRNFINGKIIVTLYKDNALIKTVSTMFKIGNVESQMTTPFEALQTNVQPRIGRVLDVLLENSKKSILVDLAVVNLDGNEKLILSLDIFPKLGFEII